MAHRRVLAIDIGAESGRAVAGSFDGERLEIEEIHRFANGFVDIGGRPYINVAGLIEASRASIARASTEGLDSVAVDTWAVDHGLIDRAGEFVTTPRGYRDPWTLDAVEEVVAALPGFDLYGATGIHTMRINTLFQLWALKQQSPWALEAADRLLMVPDMIAYGLTGVPSNELTVAGTTQLFDVCAGDWAWSLIAALEFPGRIFHDVIEPGTLIGGVRDVAGTIDVLATASHDTAAAVAGAVELRADTAFVSSGSFCIVGAEVPRPVTNSAAREANLSNDVGVSGRTRLLKDVVGLWMLAESQRQWRRESFDLSYDELVHAAGDRPALRNVFDPDEPSLLLPGDIPARIARLCGAQGALDPATTTRAIVDSIALKTRFSIDQIERAAGLELRRINVVGGGVRNRLLCQAIADACARPVIAGPEEATALGNIIVQLMARGDIGSLEDGRSVLGRAIGRTEFEPADQRRWQEGYAAFHARLTSEARADHQAT